MNIEKTKIKLQLLTNGELKELYSLVQAEMAERPIYLSNTENTPNEQCRGLQEFFANAWIH